MRALRRISLASVGLPTSLGLVTPPPPRANPQASAIGIAVKIEVSFATDEYATRVYFARVNELGALGGPIESNYVNGKYAYLLNVEPGRYVVVAAAYGNMGLPGSPGTATYTGGE